MSIIDTRPAPRLRSLVSRGLDSVIPVDLRFRKAKISCRRKSKIYPGQDLVLIYTMGKVGSSTIHRSLELGPETRVFHLHWLTRKQLRRDEDLYLAKARQNSGSEIERRFFPRYVWEGQSVARQLDPLIRNGTRPRVITLVRDPVARDVSSFFQNLDVFFDFDCARELSDRPLEKVVDDLQELFIEKYTKPSTRTENDADPRRWLDNELKTVFDTDVYETEFPRARGYEIYEGPSADVLLIRMKDLARCAPAAMREFLDTDDFEVTSANLSSEKEYAQLYRRFRERLSLPTHYLDRMYGSRLARHFYSDDEIRAFRSKWRAHHSGTPERVAV